MKKDVEGVRMPLCTMDLHDFDKTGEPNMMTEQPINPYKVKDYPIRKRQLLFMDSYCDDDTAGPDEEPGEPNSNKENKAKKPKPVTGSIAVKDMEEKPSKAAFVQSAATGRPHQLAPTSLPASSSLWSGKEKFVLLKAVCKTKLWRDVVKTTLSGRSGDAIRRKWLDLKKRAGVTDPLLSSKSWVDEIKAAQMARKHLVDCVHAAGPTQKPTCNGYQEVQPCFEEKVQCPCHLHADVVSLPQNGQLTVKVGSSEAGKTGYSIENYPEAPGVQGAHSEGTSSGNISIPQDSVVRTDTGSSCGVTGLSGIITGCQEQVQPAAHWDCDDLIQHRVKDDKQRTEEKAACGSQERPTADEIKDQDTTRGMRDGCTQPLGGECNHFQDDEGVGSHRLSAADAKNGDLNRLGSDIRLQNMKIDVANHVALLKGGHLSAIPKQGIAPSEPETACPCESSPGLNTAMLLDTPLTDSHSRLVKSTFLVSPANMPRLPSFAPHYLTRCDQARAFQLQCDAYAGVIAMLGEQEQNAAVHLVPLVKEIRNSAMDRLHQLMACSPHFFLT